MCYIQLIVYIKLICNNRVLPIMKKFVCAFLFINGQEAISIYVQDEGIFQSHRGGGQGIVFCPPSFRGASGVGIGPCGNLLLFDEEKNSEQRGEVTVKSFVSFFAEASWPTNPKISFLALARNV